MECQCHIPCCFRAGFKVSCFCGVTRHLPRKRNQQVLWNFKPSSISNTEKWLPNQVLFVPVDPFSLGLMFLVSEYIEKKLVGRKESLVTLWALSWLSSDCFLYRFLDLIQKWVTYIVLFNQGDHTVFFSSFPGWHIDTEKCWLILKEVYSTWIIGPNRVPPWLNISVQQ